MASDIEVHNISKVFEYYKRETGMKNSIRNFWHRERLYKEAVHDLSFSVERGEICAMLGPNGAGKTTMVKLLSGILFPTAGTACVRGFVPWERKNEYKKKIAVVMAQKQQLLWDLPAGESILLNKYIYEMSDEEYRRNLEELLEVFDMKQMLGVQVRRLSLGERMRFELIASLIHRPEIVYLDEPTIGLDLIAQQEMRQMIRKYNESSGATIILTSHYMKDVVDLCKHAVIINHGEKVFDGSLAELAHSERRKVAFRVDAPLDFKKYDVYGTLTSEGGQHYTLETTEEMLQPFLAEIIGNYRLQDFSVQEEEIEQKIIELYRDTGGTGV